jgi:eukaryotic-like serine/threonine-protein kinase
VQRFPVTAGPLFGHTLSRDGERDSLLEKRAVSGVSVAPERLPPVGVGDVIDGKFEVLKLLGTGGMGTVVAARHLRLDQRVALKFIHRHLAGNDDLVRRFVREAKAAARLRGEHVCRVLDAATLSDGTPYIVMEFLEGADLGEVLRAEGPLPVEEAVEFVVQACEAIAEAHGAGIVHRDLKPQNLFLTRRPSGLPLVKVLDFGISKLDDGGSGAPTATDRVVGSPAYMSPEQLRSARETDARSDIWSLGVVLYELLAGQPPFRGHNLPALALAIVSESEEPIDEHRPGLPAGLGAAIGRCLRKDASARFASVAELAAALLPFAPERAGPTMAAISHHLRGGAVGAQHARHRARNVVALAAGLGLVASSVAIGVARSREPESSTTARPAGSQPARARPPTEIALAAKPATDAPGPRVARPPTGAPFERGVEHLRRWEGNAARVALEDAVAADPRNPDVRLQLCRALYVVADRPGAIAQATRGLELPELPEATRNRIEACRRVASDDFAGAATLLAPAFARTPDLEIGLELAEAQNLAGDAIALDNTVAALRALPAPYRNDSRIDMLDGDRRELRQDARGAGEHYARAAARAAAEGRTVVQANALLWEGLELQRLARFRDANARLETAHELFTEAGERTLVPWLLHLQAGLHRALGEHHRAARMIEEALERHALSKIKDAGGAVLMAELGVFRFVTGDHEGGRRAIEESGELGKQRGEVWLATRAKHYRAWERLHAGDVRTALRLYRPALAAVKNDPAFVSAPGEALRLSGELAASRRSLEEGTNTATRANWLSNAECARVGLAMTVLAEGKPAQAEALTRRAIAEVDRMEVRDCRVRGRVALSGALRALGKTDEAHAALAEAARISSEDVSVRWELETAVAEDENARGQASAARARLARIIAEADGFKIPDAALDASIVLGELELADPSTAASGKIRLAAAAKRARAAGQRLAEKRARAALGR